jgi:hypothetical protein
MYRFARHARASIEKLGVLMRREVRASIDDHGTLAIGDTKFDLEGDHYVQRGSYERAAILENGAHIAIDSDLLERVNWYDEAMLHQILFVAFVILFIVELRSVRIVGALNLIFIIAFSTLFASVGRGEIWFGYPRALYVVRAIPIVSSLLAIRTRNAFVIAGQIAFILFLLYWQVL